MKFQRQANSACVVEKESSSAQHVNTVRYRW